LQLSDFDFSVVLMQKWQKFPIRSTQIQTCTHQFGPRIPFRLVNSMPAPWSCICYRRVGHGLLLLSFRWLDFKSARESF